MMFINMEELIQQQIMESLLEELESEYQDECEKIIKEQNVKEKQNLEEQKQISQDKDEKMEYIIKALYDTIGEWYNQVTVNGKQSCSSDRIIEKMITIAKSLEIVYSESY